jgi:preprotein translocase subunit YajC
MTLLLQAGGATTTNLFFLVAMIAVFFFMIIMPQRKRTKEQKNFGEDLKTGKNVVTSSGILGRINKIEGEIVTLEVDTKTYLKVTKNAISKELTDAIYETKN